MRSRIVSLRNGARFDSGRSRWAGVLSAEELDWCRSRAVPLAYDPAQIGWVAAEAADEEDDPGSRDRRDPPLRFRPWRREDLRAFRALLDDPEIWRFLPEQYPAPLCDELAGRLIELSAAPHHVVRAIERQGRPVGQVRLAFAPGSEDRREGEISYWLGRRWWGRGIASDAVGRFAGLCFAERPELVRIVARVHRDNAASRRVLSKAGFREEGPAPDDAAILLCRRSRGRRGEGVAPPAS